MCIEMQAILKGLLYIHVGYVLINGILGIPTTCDEGWLPFGGYCYLFGNTIVHFTEAEHYCRQHKSHVIEVYTALENDFVRDRMRERKVDCHWIGMTDEIIEGHWKWTTSESSVNFTDWFPGQPDNGAGQDCTEFYTGSDFHWHDDVCTANCAPLCKKRGYTCAELTDLVG